MSSVCATVGDRRLILCVMLQLGCDATASLLYTFRQAATAENLKFKTKTPINQSISLSV